MGPKKVWFVCPYSHDRRKLWCLYKNDDTATGGGRWLPPVGMDGATNPVRLLFYILINNPEAVYGLWEY